VSSGRYGIWNQTREMVLTSRPNRSIPVPAGASCIRCYLPNDADWSGFLRDNIRVLVVSTSLTEDSQSKLLCHHAADFLSKKGISVKHENLQNYRILPYGMHGSEGLEKLREAFDEANGILFGFPVYNYNMNSSLKAVIEHFGQKMNDKVIGLMMSAGGRASYMSGLVVANSLTLDFRSWVAPRFVYATEDAFSDDRITDPEIGSRVEELAWTVYEKSWQHRQPPPGA